MARERDPKRALAFDIYREHGGDITNREIAKKLELDEKVIAVWKGRDKWKFLLGESEIKVNKFVQNVVQQKENVVQNDDNVVQNDDNVVQNDDNVVQQKSKVVQRKDNKKTANKKKDKKKPKKRSGNPNPLNQFSARNNAGFKHGLRSKYIPQETLDLMDQLETMSPADLVWEQIKFQYASIVRAQRIMFVEDENDMTKVLKRVKLAEPESAGEDTSDDSLAIEKEYELQFAWDKHAKFLSAQSRALSELRSLIRQFLEMSSEEDERRMKLKQMSLNIEKSKLEIKRLESANDESQQENTETKLEKYFQNLQEAFVNKNDEDEE